MKLLWTFAIFISLLNPVSVFAGNDTLVISDFDDTIRQTNVRSAFKVFYVVVPRSAFEDMEKLYKRLNQGQSQGLAVVSASPTFLRNRILNFLRDKNYADFTLTLKPPGSGTKFEYKIKAITDILEQNPDKKNVVLVGDDAEVDQEAYAKIRELFPERTIRSYIRRIHEEAGRVHVEQGQIPFYSSAEIALSESVTGSFNEDTTVEIIENTIDLFNMSPKNIVPGFAECPNSEETSVFESLLERSSSRVREVYGQWRAMLDSHCAQR